MKYKKEEETTTKRNIVKICFTSCQQSAGQNFDRHSRTDKTSEQSNSSYQQCKTCDVFVTGLHKYKKHWEYKHNTSRPQGVRQQKKKHTVDFNNKPDDVDLKTPQIKKQRNKKKRKRLKRCFVCCHKFALQRLHIHMHSFVHHQAIENLKGSGQVEHKCWACDVSMTGMQQYKKHIGTANHKHLMTYLNGKTNISVMDYNIDDELKAACVQRDQETFLKGGEKWKKNKGKKNKAKSQQIKQKFIQNDQSKNKRKSVHFTIPVRTHVEFKNDEGPLSCYFSSWEGQQNSSTSRPNQKRRPESVFDWNRFDCPDVKGPPSEVPAKEKPAGFECPTPKEKVERICTEKMSSKNEVAFIDLTCSPKSVQRGDGHISAMLGTIKKSTDHQNVNIGSGQNGKSCTKKIVRQTSKSSYNEEIDQKPETRKMHEGKAKLVKGTTSKKSMNTHSPEESRPKTCSNDVTPALRNKLTQTNAKTKLQRTQDIKNMPCEDIKGPKASVVSLEAKEQKAEKIRGLDSKTSATSNDLQIQKVQLKTEHVKLVSAENLQSVPSNLQKPRRKKQEISNITQGNPEAIDTSRKENVTKLMTLCNTEENLRGSLENVGEKLFQAYSTLQSTYTKVQHLLAVKQQVTSEMASLRAKRIQILQNMKEPCQSHIDVCCEDQT